MSDNLVDEMLAQTAGTYAFDILVHGYNSGFVERMRQPHPDFPVSKKSGSVFEEKENE